MQDLEGPQFCLFGLLLAALCSRCSFAWPSSSLSSFSACKLCLAKGKEVFYFAVRAPGGKIPPKTGPGSGVGGLYFRAWEITEIRGRLFFSFLFLSSPTLSLQSPRLEEFIKEKRRRGEKTSEASCVFFPFKSSSSIFVMFLKRKGRGGKKFYPIPPPTPPFFISVEKIFNTKP